MCSTHAKYIGMMPPVFLIKLHANQLLQKLSLPMISHSKNIILAFTRLRLKNLTLYIIFQHNSKFILNNNELFCIQQGTIYHIYNNRYKAMRHLKQLDLLSFSK